MVPKRPEFPPDEVEENGNLVQVFLHRAKFFGFGTVISAKVTG